MQVTGNLESQRRQYALVDRAKELGFTEVEVIDQDLGRSGAGRTERPGFERLVTTVCEGSVGAVFCLEASRLARNGRDWHHLIDFCALVGTLLVDPDGLYDPRHPNDRLLLGLKGTMSEFELTLFRQRSFEAIRQKAARGELQFRLPVGFQWQDGRIEMEPDRRIRDSIESVFRRFARLGSIRQVLMTMRSERITVPAVARNGIGHDWKLPVYNTIHRILTNTMYAGAYAYGKTHDRTTVVGSTARKTTGHRKEMSDWSVLIREHHAGYISWKQFEQNQKTIASNAHMLGKMSSKAGRGGRFLLAGLLRCARCGRMMHVVYGGKHQPSGRYECRGANLNHGEGRRCLAFGTLRPDEVIARTLLDAVTPKAIAEAVALASQSLANDDEAISAAKLELEHLEYEATLARRRYEAVDPENRLVAGELEKRWNSAMGQVESTRGAISKLSDAKKVSVSIDQAALLSLGDSLKVAWNSPAADNRTKQRIVRALVREIVASIDEGSNELVFLIHWHGGRHSEVRAAKKKSGDHGHKASVEVEDVIRQMWARWKPEEIAATLNRIKLKTGTGLTWNGTRVVAVARRMKLSNDQQPSDVPRDTLTLAEATRKLGVSNWVVLRLIREGLVHARQVVPNAPYEIERKSLDSPAVVAAVALTLKRGTHARKWSKERKSLRLPGIDDD
jgi:DNA invertase Pin-like site-specific DNA recombinase